MQFWCLVQSIAVNQNLSPRGRVKTPTLIAGVAILTPIGFKERKWPVINYILYISCDLLLCAL